MARYLPQESLSVCHPVGVKVELRIRQGLVEILDGKRQFVHLSIGMQQVSVGKAMRRIVSDDHLPTALTPHFQLYHKVGHPPLDARVPMAEPAVHIVQEHKGTLSDSRHTKKILYPRCFVNPLSQGDRALELLRRSPCDTLDTGN
jgi:hypothetical protein